MCSPPMFSLLLLFLEVFHFFSSKAPEKSFIVLGTCFHRRYFGYSPPEYQRWTPISRTTKPAEDALREVKDLQELRDNNRREDGEQNQGNIGSSYHHEDLV